VLMRQMTGAQINQDDIVGELLRELPLLLNRALRQSL
jgi:hypothetical protein